MERISKKRLRAEAQRLGAEEILGKKSNVYNYENARDRLCKETGGAYYGVYYSAGTYGNTGRLDELKAPNGEHIKFIFYTE